MTPAYSSREVGANIYQLINSKRSNENTCISEKPFVRVRRPRKKGQVPRTVLARNAANSPSAATSLVAFVVPGAGTIEDAILVSDKLVKGDDEAPSIHIEETNRSARYELGPEEVYSAHSYISQSLPFAISTKAA